MKSLKFNLLSFIILFVFNTGLLAQKKVLSTHESPLLASLKQQNKLGEWLYARIDSSYNYPKETLSFLMNTEQEMWRKPITLAEKEAWLLLLSNQGYNQLYSGNILKSITCYEQAYNYYITNKLNVEGIAEYVLKPWANNYTRLGDYEKALFIQKKTLEYAQKNHLADLEIAVYNNMGISYRSMGDYQNATHAILNGLKRANPGSRAEILLNNVLADVYKDKNELELASRVISRNISKQRHLKQDFETAYWLLSSYVTAGDIEFAERNFKSSQNYYQQALQVNDTYYQGNRVREQAYIFTQIGKIKLAQHQAQQALTYFDKTLNSLGIKNLEDKNTAQKVFGDNRMVDVLYQISRAQQMLGDRHSSLKTIKLALQAADKIRLELADAKTKQRFQAESKLMAEQAIDIAFNLLETSKQPIYAEAILDLVEQTKARTLLDDIRRRQQQLSLQTGDTLLIEKANLERAISYQEKEYLQYPKDQAQIEERITELKFRLNYLEKQLTLKYPALLPQQHQIPLNAASLFKRIPMQTQFLEFFIGTNYLYSILIQNRKITHIHKLGSANAVKSKLSAFNQKYYQQGPSAMMNHPKAFFTASKAIFDLLIAPFHLNTNKSLVIVPDDVLGHLSFDGLITGTNYSTAISNWPFLIKKLNTSYAFSLKTWLNQSEKKHSTDPDFQGLFLTHQHQRKQFLPAVAREEQLIKTIVNGSFFKDKEADSKQFFKSFDRANVLHISTHAYLSGNQQEPTLAFEDTEVFLFELAARKTAPDLVVLSACRTADGNLANGEGIISLSRGFTAIGAGGTIAGLWNVNDHAASNITASCYRNLTKGVKTSKALHLAKLSWLNQRRNAAQEYLPYYWDALIYMGFDQEIELQPANHSLYMSAKIALTVLIAAILIFIILRKRNKKRLFPLF